MTTPEPAPAEAENSMSPLEYMQDADKELAAGNGRKAAGLLWKAVKSTFIGLAETRGLDYSDDLFDVALALEAEEAAPKHYFTGNLVIGESLRDHAGADGVKSYELEGYEVESSYKVNREFIVDNYGEYE